MCVCVCVCVGVCVCVCACVCGLDAIVGQNVFLSARLKINKYIYILFYGCRFLSLLVCFSMSELVGCFENA